MAKVLRFQRSDSFEKLMEELRGRGPNAEGVVAIILDRDGHASFRMVGFKNRGAYWTALGLLDWVKADLLTDVVDGS